MHLDKMYVLDGAVEALEFANRVVGGRTCIVTNCPRPITALILGADAAQEIIDALSMGGSKPLNIVCADDEIELSKVVCDVNGNTSTQTTISKILPKPKTDMVLEAARRLGVDPSECLLVGDSKFDMQCINDADGVGVGINVEQGAFMIASVKEIAYLTEFLDFQTA